MDSESLDRCIQTALSGLYPPFQATSPTVLCQVLNVVDSCYRGDALRYLIHFLLPAKQLLENLQQDTCVQYCGLLFRHEGWPLCLQEKVVVQLCPLDQRLLHPGDFYLLVSPPAAGAPPSRGHSASCRSSVSSSPRLLLCSVSVGTHHVEQQEVSEVALRCLFSMDWLDSVNKEREQRGASRLEHCLLSAHGDVSRVSWEDLVHPQFVSGPHTSLKEEKEPSVKDGDVIKTSHDHCGDTESPRQDTKLLPPSKTDQSAASSEAEDSEGEYVELLELPLPGFSPQKGSLTRSISLQHCTRTTTHTHENTAAHSHEHTAAHSHEHTAAHSHEHTAAHSHEHTHQYTAAHSHEHTAAHSHEHTHQYSAAHSHEHTAAHSHEHTHQYTAAHSHEHTAAHTHSSWPCVEVRPHRTPLTGENPTILAPVSPPPSSSAPPDVGGTSSWTSQEQTEGTEPGRSLKINIVQHTKHREEEEREAEEEKNEREQKEKQEEKHEIVPVYEGEEEKEGEQLEECRSDEDLLLHTHSAEGGAEREEEEEESEQGGAEEVEVEVVEVEEDVQMISVHQSQDRRGEQKVMKQEGGEEKEGEEREGGQMHRDENADSCSNTHSEDSYSESSTQQKHCQDYSENNITQTHSQGSYSENNTQHKQSEGSYSENSKHTSLTVMNQDSVWTEEPENRPEEETKEEEKEKSEDEEEQKEKKEEEVKREEECGCEEVGEGGTAELQTEVLSTQSASPSAGQTSQSRFYSVLLRSGAICAPGTRDRSGRAVLTVCAVNSVWSNPDCDSAELVRLLLYYTSILRKEVAALGLTVLVDARRAAPAPSLLSALHSLQDNTPGSIHSVLLLVNKDSSLCLDKLSALQVEVLSSLRSLKKHVDLQQLPAEFGGSLSFSQSSWLCFRSKVEQLTSQCQDVINLLQKTIHILEAIPLSAAAPDVKLLLSTHKKVMCSILEDSRLLFLQREGGPLLLWLQREESRIGATEDYRAAVESVSTLYDEVDKLLHRVVNLSNSRTEELNFIVDLKSLEEGFTEGRSWLEQVGEVRLKSLNELEESLELLNKKQQDFKEFHTAAYEQYKRGKALLACLERWSDVSSADLQVYKVKVHSFWAQLQNFSQRVKITGQNIERAVRLYSFLDQAYGWALVGMRQLAAISMEECMLPDKCQAAIGHLENYRRQHPAIPDAQFQEMKAVAGELQGERGLRQWSFAWSKCQETKKMFERKMEAALKTRDSTHRQHSDSALSRGSTSTGKTLTGLWGSPKTSSSSSSSLSCSPEEEDTTFSPPTAQHTSLLRRLLRSSSPKESSDQVGVFSSHSLPRLTSPSRRQQLRRTQSFLRSSTATPTPNVSQYGPSSHALCEPVRRGNTGVFIRGLEVSRTEAADRPLCPRTAAHGWGGARPRSPGTPATPRTSGSPAADSRPRGSKLHHVVEEMVTTEREYVRSLRYIIHHYFPEMERPDLPQDLRGKRSVVFGNLEKLLDFHSQFFLRELEACWKHPLRVPHCFLRHQEQFSLYALYSKNKPKSDALLGNHGNAFFRRKQVELGDKMDLSSYLLKPVQRMTKYALLLTDLMKEVDGAQEADLVALQAATNMVKFQLRHGNDLLAMDAIQDCDVNLKEQGQLIRQDEFTVCTGRRKCQRHIFLFEELVLFSKHKKMEGGLDVFIYKHSFKTADIGLTESSGDNGLRFEIWFRRRTSKNQTFILQAATPDLKHTWTTDITRILWTQATKNKEMRLKEMVSMGFGNKPYLDIQPSAAAINDRAVHYMMKSRGTKTRVSIAVSVFDHSNPFKRGLLTSDPPTSGPSSSTLLGPLNLHMYSQALPSSLACQSSFITSCIEEDEQEHETSSQPSMTTESSGSSSHCLSSSTGSDSGCVSSRQQSPSCQDPPPNKQHVNRRHSSPGTITGPTSIV